MCRLTTNSIACKKTEINISRRIFINSFRPSERVIRITKRQWVWWGQVLWWLLTLNIYLITILSSLMHSRMVASDEQVLLTSSWSIAGIRHRSLTTEWQTYDSGPRTDYFFYYHRERDKIYCSMNLDLQKKPCVQLPRSPLTNLIPIWISNYVRHKV